MWTNENFNGADTCLISFTEVNDYVDSLKY